MCIHIVMWPNAFQDRNVFLDPATPSVKKAVDFKVKNVYFLYAEYNI